tara:strand:- start:242 stop:436 length:195 start_codon:yes stop_codon:yes gene_type:complete
MEYFEGIKWTIIILFIIGQVSKSIRIQQLKKVDKNKIDAIGDYEKKSIPKHIFRFKKKDNEPCL